MLHSLKITALATLVGLIAVAAPAPVLAQSDADLAAEAARPGIDPERARALDDAARTAAEGTMPQGDGADAGDSAEEAPAAQDAAVESDPVRADDQAPTSELEAAVAEAPGSFDWDMIIQPIRTDTPRRTVRSIMHIVGELEDDILDYRAAKTQANLKEIENNIDRFLSLIDLSGVPPAARREVGITTMTHLLDIFGRIGLPPLEEVPGEEAFTENAAAVWRIPETPLRIVRMEAGPRRYEYLISGRAVDAAPRFAEAIGALPLETALPMRSWAETWPQLTGPMIPAAAVRAVPTELRALVWDTPIWKIIGVFAATGAFALAIWIVHRALAPLRQGDGRRAIPARLLTPVAVLAAILLLDAFFESQLNLSGDFSALVQLTATGLFYFGLAWVFWAGANAVFDWRIASPKVSNDGLNASLLRLAARLIGLIGAVIIVAIGAGNLGFPIYSLVAGLGVGGLAVALAVRPTLENLIGGIVLFADKPVRVGDFCTFGTNMGTVESIGLRSTQIRALDRTVTAIPNAKFADMEIINWARCDRMLILQTISLRYETSPDQLRFTLARVREMFHAHPRIDPDTVRVRFIGYGESGLNVEIRVYAMTREWNDFFAITEDVLFRVYAIVEEAGTGFAFPSRTLYMAQDKGLDAERTKASADRVRTWRRTGKLPFPRLSAQRIHELEGTLDYPPRGSVETWSGGTPPEEAAPAGEFLSAPSDVGKEKPLEREKAELPEDDKR